MRQGFSRLLLVVSILTLPLSLLGGEVNVQLTNMNINGGDSVPLCALFTGNGGPLSSLTVVYSLQSVSATYGIDYSSPSGESGYLDVKGQKLCITVDTNDTAGDNKVFKFQLTTISPSSNEIGPRDTTTVTIVESKVSFDSSSTSVPEDEGTLRLCANTGGISSNFTITVNITVTSGTANAEDYSVPQQFEFLPGNTTSCLDVNIIDDDLYEDNETFVVTMESVSSPAQISSPASVTVTITDNDRDSLTKGRQPGSDEYPEALSYCEDDRDEEGSVLHIEQQCKENVRKNKGMMEFLGLDPSHSALAKDVNTLKDKVRVLEKMVRKLAMRVSFQEKELEDLRGT